MYGDPHDDGAPLPEDAPTPQPRVESSANAVDVGSSEIMDSILVGELGELSVTDGLTPSPLSAANGFNGGERDDGGDSGLVVVDSEESDSEVEATIGTLIERAASSPDVSERIRCFLAAARLYETDAREPEKALITLQAALAEDYGNAEAADEMGRLADRQGRKRDLIGEYEASLGEVVDPTQRVALLLLLSRWHDDLGDTSGAEAKLHKAVATDPASMPAVRAMSEHLTRRTKWNELAEHLAQAGGRQRRTQDRVELLLAAADLQRTRLGNPTRASELYAEVLELDPDATGALEAMTEVAWQDENWVKVMPLLERLTMLPNRTAAERVRTHQRAALTALRVGEDQRARVHALALVGMEVPDGDGGDGGMLRFLSDWLDIAVARNWWEDVAVIGPWLREQPGFRLPPSEEAELAARLGRAHLLAGRRDEAATEFERALDLDPNHRKAREQIAELRDQMGDAAGALEHKKRLSEAVSAPDDRFRLLVEMARAERDAMENPQAALALFEEARALKPSERSILGELLDLYTERKQWLPASEVLLSLAENEEAPTRSRYLVAAANILHYELGESDQALELYDKVLDDDPTDLKTFERQDKILAGRADYKGEAKAYRRMIKRIGPATDDTKKAALLMLWRGLAEILRTRLGDHTTALAALDVCVQLDPTALVDREALAELYETAIMMGGSASAEESGELDSPLRKAVEHRTYLLEKSDDGSALVRHLQALRRIYGQAGLWDRVYNVCAALTVLQAADAEERGFYEQVAGSGLAMAQAALTEEVWQKVVYDAGEERRLSLLFSCVAPVVAMARSQEARAYGLKDKQRLDPANDPSGVAHMFEFGAGVLNVQPPLVFINNEAAVDVEIINLRENLGSGATIMISPAIVKDRVQKDVAFVVGRTLALTRADHLVLSRHMVPSPLELTGIVHAAFKLCQPNTPLPNPGVYEPYLQLFKKALPPQALEPLSSLVPWLDEHWRTLDLESWRRGAERTADRAGLLLCGDLGAAVRVIHATRGPAAAEAVIDLCRWSVSEGHLGLRELLGVAVAAAA
jgi:tetratricopeptide (TPR) repeat protein